MLVVQSFGNDTIRMHCQRLDLCGYQQLVSLLVEVIIILAVQTSELFISFRNASTIICSPIVVERRILWPMSIRIHRLDCKSLFYLKLSRLKYVFRVEHTCCQLYNPNPPNHVPTHDGNDCFIYELPDGSTHPDGEVLQPLTPLNAVRFPSYELKINR